MKKVLFVFFILVASINLVSTTQISVSVSTTSATIGERITLKFIVKTLKKIDSLRIEYKNQKFEIIKRYDLQLVSNDNLMTYKKNFEIAFFKTGNFIVGPFSVKLFNEKSMVEKMETNSIPVTIRSVLEEGDKDIKPLKDLFEIKGNPLFILKYIIAIIFIVAAFILIRLYLKKRKDSNIQSGKIILPPEEEFKKNINTLWNSNLLKSGKTKFFFLSLTEYYKLFMSRLYGFNAEDLTTYEIVSNLKNHETDKTILKNFDQVFLISDLTKFAKYIPSISDMDEIRTYLYKIIEIVGDRRRKREEEEKNATP